MGYTHYFRINPKVKQSKLNAIVKDLKVIIKDGIDKEVLGRFNGEPAKSVDELITPETVSFNGIGDQSHEAFYFVTKNSSQMSKGMNTDHAKGFLFSFIKTNRKDYDIYVRMCLSVMKVHLSEDIEISSDGGPEALEEGFNQMSLLLKKTTLKRKLKNL